MGAAAAAAITGRQRRIMNAFRGAGALSPATARSLAELDIDESWVFDRLVARAVLRQSEPGRYYLDEEGWQRFHRARHRRALIAAAAVLLLMLGVLFVVLRR